MKERGEDWVAFRLKAKAPNWVALGGARFSGKWARADEPFRCTRGEWEVCLKKLGWFEEVGGVQESKVEKSKS